MPQLHHATILASPSKETVIARLCEPSDRLEETLQQFKKFHLSILPLVDMQLNDLSAYNIKIEEDKL